VEKFVVYAQKINTSQSWPILQYNMKA